MSIKLVLLLNPKFLNLDYRIMFILKNNSMKIFKTLKKFFSRTSEPTKIIQPVTYKQDPINPSKWDLDAIFSSLNLDCSDFFIPATCAHITVDFEDLHWIMPIVKKYGYDGVNAVKSFIAQQSPMLVYVNDKFEAALKELKDLNPYIYSYY